MAQLYRLRVPQQPSRIPAWRNATACRQGKTGDPGASDSPSQSQDRPPSSSSSSALLLLPPTTLSNAAGPSAKPARDRLAILPATRWIWFHSPAAAWQIGKRLELHLPFPGWRNAYARYYVLRCRCDAIVMQVRMQPARQWRRRRVPPRMPPPGGTVEQTSPQDTVALDCGHGMVWQQHGMGWLCNVLLPARHHGIGFQLVLGQNVDRARMQSPRWSAPIPGCLSWMLPLVADSGMSLAVFVLDNFI